MTDDRTTDSPADDLAADLELALALADAADEITLARFGALDLRVDTKPDNTPVSDADTAVETMIRARLAEARPADAVLGEEEGLGDSPRDARRQWVLDPVDGTKNFVRGVAVWGTLIGLEVDGEVAVGAVSAPAIGRRWWAARGFGAFASTAHGGQRRLAVSSVAKLPDAFLSYASIEGWADAGRLDGFIELTRTVWRTRAYGDFWSHMMVAEGSVDLACEPAVSHWDLAALQVIVEEAGGTFTDLSGRRGPLGGSIVTTNGLLHDQTLATLG